MRILPVMPNYVNRNCNNNKMTNVNKKQNTSFQGALNNKEVVKVVNMLAEKNTEVIDNCNITMMKKVMNSLYEKWQDVTNGSMGLYVLNKEDLAKILGENAAKYDTNCKYGVCIGIGDVYGPVEKWNKAYEVKTLLMNEKL